MINNNMLKNGLDVLEFDEVVENKEQNYLYSINNVNDAYDLFFRCYGHNTGEKRRIHHA